MLVKVIRPVMRVVNNVKVFDIVQVTKCGTRTISKARLASGLNFVQAVDYANGMADSINTYQAMKGV